MGRGKVGRKGEVTTAAKPGITNEERGAKAHVGDGGEKLWRRRADAAKGFPATCAGKHDRKSVTAI